MSAELAEKTGGDGKPLPHDGVAYGHLVDIGRQIVEGILAHTALSPQGDLYVSDGYGNSRVHRFSADGTLVQSWGEPGAGNFAARSTRSSRVSAPHAMTRVRGARASVTP